MVTRFLDSELTIERITTDWTTIHFLPQIWFIRPGDRVVSRTILPLDTDGRKCREPSARLACRRRMSAGSTHRPMTCPICCRFDEWYRSLRNSMNWTLLSYGATRRSLGSGGGRTPENGPRRIPVRI